MLDEIRKKKFWAKVDIKESHECWNYKGCKNRYGYGQFWIGFMQVLAHRFAFECAYSDKINYIPDNLLVCHICNNPACCNPMHLYLGTHADNARDRSKKVKRDILALFDTYEE